LEQHRHAYDAGAQYLDDIGFSGLVQRAGGILPYSKAGPYYCVPVQTTIKYV